MDGNNPPCFNSIQYLENVNSNIQSPTNTVLFHMPLLNSTDAEPAEQLNIGTAFKSDTFLSYMYQTMGTCLEILYNRANTNWVFHVNEMP